MNNVKIRLLLLMYVLLCLWMISMKNNSDPVRSVAAPPQRFQALRTLFSFFRRLV